MNDIAMKTFEPVDARLSKLEKEVAFLKALMLDHNGQPDCYLGIKKTIGEQEAWELCTRSESPHNACFHCHWSK